ncbi:MAG: TIGR02147 family protein [Pseudobdellovibrionaceae bacterium]
MTLYNYRSYKDCLFKILLEKKKSRPQYTFEALAKACGIQKTYLSRVLKHKGNLTEDQLYSACVYLKFSKMEIKYVLTLWRWENSSHPDRREYYIKKIEDLRSQSLKTENKIKVNTVSSAKESLAEYYSDPFFPLIHMFLTLERFQKNPEALKEYLAIPKSKIHLYLDRLNDMNLIEFKDKKWTVIQDTIHLPRTSHLIKTYRALMRLKALEKMDRSSEEDFYSFSVVFSSNAEVQKEIQNRFLSFLSDVQKIVKEEKESDVYQMNFDLLKWS